MVHESNKRANNITEGRIIRCSRDSRSLLREASGSTEPRIRDCMRYWLAVRCSEYAAAAADVASATTDVLGILYVSG